jgi:predicted nucleic acid-binding protein
MKSRIYTDTSVIGGCFDEEFESASLQLIQRFKMGEAIIVVSDLTLLELELAPLKVKGILKEISDENKEHVEFQEEARELARLYIAEGIVGSNNLVDAQHIAIATVSRVDVLVSWNFKHIVNLQRIHGYNSVNLRHGYPLLEIRTPQEVISYGNE